ncbi:hypothetical protein [Acinetobacter piscicola]|uniref:hypothetical protein n=1 Tax=Acinetobacter piscicola TaxID=2006115 RepID=UPI001021D429|nr:hypothetical protein [Acinetobacter piscicola]RYL22203.1 hypothetical protein EWP19_17080 [Acinetobacter piscicola]
MKATDLIKSKGIQYAIEIVANAPESVLAWNEGYEFTCGQAINISDEDREKYFVDMADLKRLVESHELVESKGGLENAKEDELWANELGFSYKELVQAIADVESWRGEHE